jgi:hypothetical protein
MLTVRIRNVPHDLSIFQKECRKWYQYKNSVLTKSNAQFSQIRDIISKPKRTGHPTKIDKDAQLLE